MATRLTALSAVFALALAALTGCNTAEGLEQDLDQAGDEIQEAF